MQSPRLAAFSLRLLLLGMGVCAVSVPALAAPPVAAATVAVWRVPVSAGDAIRGDSARAQVTLVEFADYQCPYCSRADATLVVLAKKYGDKLRLVYKHNPLPFHARALPAALAAAAAGRQGKFWEMHDRLMAAPTLLGDADFEAAATSLALDVQRFRRDLVDPALARSIAADQALAASLGADGTPTFYVNGRKLVGAQPLDAFAAIIDQELAKAGALDRGAAYYDRLIAGGLTSPPPPPPAAVPESANDVMIVPVNSGDHIRGDSATAQVTIVTFSEFQCPFCRRLQPALTQLLENSKGRVRLVFKHNPLPFHAQAVPAALATLAAEKQGKFWQMHDKLFDLVDLRDVDFGALAGALGLDVPRFRRDMLSPALMTRIKFDLALTESLGIRGAPTSFINGRKVIGAQPLAVFQAVVDEELAKAGAAKGPGYYDRIMAKAQADRDAAEAPDPRDPVQ